MTTQDEIYRDIVAHSKVNSIQDFIVIKMKDMTSILEKHNIELAALGDTVLKTTKSNVYLDRSILDDYKPADIKLAELRTGVLKKLPSFIKMVACKIPLYIETGGAGDSSFIVQHDKIGIFEKYLLTSTDEELLRGLGRLYTQFYITHIDDYAIPEDFPDHIADLVSGKTTKLPTHIWGIVDSLSKVAKFNKIKVFINLGYEEHVGDIMHDLFELNNKCKEDTK